MNFDDNDEDIPPYQRHSWTSLEAAESVQFTTATKRAKVLDWFRKNGAATDEMLIDAFGGPSMANGIRPRRVELVKAGLLIDSGKTSKTRSRRNAVLWVAIKK